VIKSVTAAAADEFSGAIGAPLERLHLAGGAHASLRALHYMTADSHSQVAQSWLFSRISMAVNWRSSLLPLARRPAGIRTGSLERELKNQKPGEVESIMRRRVEAYLDQGHGNCYLKESEVANTVQNALLFTTR